VGEGQGGDEEGKQKWCVGDLLADDRCSPRSQTVCEAPISEGQLQPVEENWDSEEEAEEEIGDGEEQAE